MFRFAHPTYLWLILPILLLVLVFFRGQYLRKKRLREWGDFEITQTLMPNVSYFKTRLKFYFQLVALLLLMIVLAQPQFGTKEEIVKKSGVEVMIALDVSNSMMAQDIQPNRLEKAKYILSQLIDNMEDDKIGLIVFAGDAYVQLPITSDHRAAKMFLSTISTNMVPRQGTAIGSAIDMGIQSFGTKKTDVGRAIIILTDGENHEDDAIAAAKLAAENNIKIFVIGMGTTKGTPIPIGNTLSFKKDNKGNVVVTKLNETMATTIAKAAKGIYVRADNTNNAFKTVEKQLGKMTQKESQEKVYAQYNEQYQSFAIVGLLLLMIEFFILGRKNKWLSKIKFFDVN